MSFIYLEIIPHGLRLTKKNSKWARKQTIRYQAWQLMKERTNKYGFSDENYIYFPVKSEVDRWLILVYQGSMLRFLQWYLGIIS